MQLQHNKMAALYCRLSRDDGNLSESNSIQNQEMMLVQYAQQNGFSVVDIYKDDAVIIGPTRKNRFNKRFLRFGLVFSLVPNLTDKQKQAVVEGRPSRIGFGLPSTTATNNSIWRCKMAVVFALSNQKGGVAKSATTVNLGIGLARQGKRVLLVDCDPQASLTVSLGIQAPDEIPVTLATILGGIVAEQALSPTDGIIHHTEGIDLIPANIELSGLELSLVNVMCRETILRQYLEIMKPHYDYILLDTCPSLGMLTINALAAADYVIIPSSAQYLPIKGLELLLRTIANVKRKMNPALQIGGILLTMVDARTNFTRDIIALVDNTYHGNIHVFPDNIPFSVRAAEITATGVSIYTHDPHGKVAAAYESLTREVLNIA